MLMFKQPAHSGSATFPAHLRWIYYLEFLSFSMEIKMCLIPANHTTQRCIKVRFKSTSHSCVSAWMHRLFFKPIRASLSRQHQMIQIAKTRAEMITWMYEAAHLPRDCTVFRPVGTSSHVCCLYLEVVFDHISKRNLYFIHRDMQTLSDLNRDKYGRELRHIPAKSSSNVFDFIGCGQKRNDLNIIRQNVLVNYNFLAHFRLIT